MVKENLGTTTALKHGDAGKHSTGVKKVEYKALQAVVKNAQNLTDTPGEYIPDTVREVGNYVFQQLCQIKTGWRVPFKTKEEVIGYKRQLLQAMFENGIKTMPQIETGLIQARRDTGDFLPSVGKFIAWCKPASEGELNAGMRRIWKPERRIESTTHAERVSIAKTELAKLRDTLKRMKS